MGLNFATFYSLENLWVEKLMLSIVWENYNFHIYLISATHLLALRLLLKIVRGFRYQ